MVLSKTKYSDLEAAALNGNGFQTRHHSRFGIDSAHLRECLAEFLGTFVLVAFGDGVLAQVVLGKGNNGDVTNVGVCWGIALMLGVFVSGGVSGGHLNPAVSTTLALFGRFEWRKVPGYILAQVLGAFFGAYLVFLVYRPMFNVIDPERMTTQGVFATYPHESVPNATAFFTEFIGTAFLLLGLFAFADEQNKPASRYSSPFAVGFLLTGIGMAFGMNTGASLNPARDFAPRLFSALAGWGFRVFSLSDYYSWIPIVAPFFGGALGGLAYVGLVELHHPKNE